MLSALVGESTSAPASVLTEVIQDASLTDSNVKDEYATIPCGEESVQDRCDAKDECQVGLLGLTTTLSMPSVSVAVLSANDKDEGMGVTLAASPSQSDDAEWSEVTFDDVFDVNAFMKAEDDKSAGMQSEAWGGGCTSRVCGGPPR